jgi:D-serine deaminase-like pyridoxal phosphate-dependent protein
MAITMVGMALTVAACGSRTTTNTTTTNTTTTELGNDVMMDANAMDMGLPTTNATGGNAMTPPPAGNTTTTTNSTTTSTTNKM